MKHFSLRLGSHQTFYVLVVVVLLTLIITGTSDQTAAAQTENGWVDDGQVIRLETPIDRVGIGTASPSSKLHILELEPIDANSGQLQITGTARSKKQIGASKFMLLGRAFDYGFVQSHNSDPLVLNPLGNNVGIGTTGPGALFHVHGGQNNQRWIATTIPGSMDLQ